MDKNPVINIADIDYMDFGDGGKFEARLGRVSPAVGARELGYNITRLAPGKRAFPFHLHHHNEEMFFILEGSGTLRYGEREIPVKKGDFIGCPAGTGSAHQIINSGKGELKYLAVSTSRSPEVAEYPDSNKVGALCGTFDAPGLRLFVTKESAVDYFEGESD